MIKQMKENGGTNNGLCRHSDHVGLQSLPPVVCRRAHSCLIYLICVCLRIVVSNAYCVCLYFAFLLCYLLLWTVHFRLPLRYPLPFIIYSNGRVTERPKRVLLDRCRYLKGKLLCFYWIIAIFSRTNIVEQNHCISNTIIEFPSMSLTI